ncbi:proteasome accessory factor B/proteasome accessory factor C [Haloactinospora alba]|uniref:Proteasome accessory factor B/proteasome accessory factor C n=1 Tax=Haloactinospora alba TaxID=405555 RepID=A0A543NIX8_9ACTN|nr:WYL domain-containing protein [Haloactinospora alba]TQN31776.1 proteasome accessory factor B/proteasome accessory factor C [Haloactinospora alba]
MSRKKTERQINLVICLLATRRFLTAREIRATVAGYTSSAGTSAEDDAAFKRMFERDKKELRDSGIPIETGNADIWSGDEGYRISRSAYELPAIELRADEAAVLGLAARAWRDAALGGMSANALLKLRAAGVPVDSETAPGVTPVVGTDEPAFLAVWRALRDRRPVSFAYRKPGAEATRRHVEPWGVVNRNGHWYMAGYDRDRQARRVFRLGRIRGDVTVLGNGPTVVVPEGVDVRSVVTGYHSEPEEVARLRVRVDAAHELRRKALRIVPGSRGPEEPWWDYVEYPYGDLAALVESVAGFGDRVVLEHPASARTALMSHLSGAATQAPDADTAVPAGNAEPVEQEGQERRADSAEQLRRLLMLVPYALSHDVGVSEVATHFGLSQEQVLKDLSLLWMCGLPGYTPGDLIDVDLDAARSTGEIIIANADTLASPLKLTVDEAASVIVGVELLGELPGVADSEALNRLRAKLRSAAGAGEPAAETADRERAVDRLVDSVRVRVDLSEEVRTVQRKCDEALRNGWAVHLRYLSGYVDEVTERDVDPMGLVAQDGHMFLEGWCRLRGNVRLFRLDRVLRLAVLPTSSVVPAGARRRDLTDGVLQLSTGDARVTLDLAPSARWVTEEYVCSDVQELDSGWWRATLRTPVPEWVRRLALLLGPRCRVVAPAELAERVGEDARRALAGYSAHYDEGTDATG